MTFKLDKNLGTFLKLLISISFLVLVFYQLDWNEIKQVLTKINLLYFGIAILFFIGSQLVSVFRLDFCFRAINVQISIRDNCKLYLIGMFYNFFIPGGIGGDAYKVYFLNKELNTPIKPLTSSVFIDRVFGLIGIVICLVFLLFFLEFINIQNQLFKFPILLAFLLIFIVLSYFSIQSWFKKFSSVYYKAVFLSIIIQGLQLLCVLFILKSLNIEHSYIPYLILFLISSITSIISFAGIGVREAVFFYGAQVFNFNENVSTTIGLCFSLITMFVSFFGIWFLFRPVRLNESD